MNALLVFALLSASAPAIPPARPWKVPVPAMSALPNGLRVVTLSRETLPLVSVAVAIQAGSTLDPADRPGLASATAMMLEDGGAGAMKASELSRALDELGGSLHVECDRMGVRIEMTVIEPKLERALALLGDLTMKPRFDEAEWPAAKERRLAQIVRLNDEPRFAATFAFDRAIFPEHAHGQPVLGTNASVEGIAAADLRAFHASFYGPKTTSVVLVGAVKPERAAKLVALVFGGWSSAAQPAKVLPAAPRSGKKIILIDRPGAPQTEVRVGHVGVASDAAEVPALLVLQTVLGGAFTSRLNQNLREKHGYTYGVGSGFELLRSPGRFLVRTAVKTDVTAPAVKEIINELDGVFARPLSAEEIAKGRALVRSFWVDLLSDGEEAARLYAEQLLLDRPIDDLAKISAALDALDVGSVAAASKRLIFPGEMTIVLMGDRKVIEAPLRALSLGVELGFGP